MGGCAVSPSTYRSVNNLPGILDLKLTYVSCSVRGQDEVGIFSSIDYSDFLDQAAQSNQYNQNGTNPIVTGLGLAIGAAIVKSLRGSHELNWHDISYLHLDLNSKLIGDLKHALAELGIKKFLSNKSRLANAQLSKARSLHPNKYLIEIDARFFLASDYNHSTVQMDVRIWEPYARSQRSKNPVYSNRFRYLSDPVTEYINLDDYTNPVWPVFEEIWFADDGYVIKSSLNEGIDSVISMLAFDLEKLAGNYNQAIPRNKKNVGSLYGLVLPGYKVSEQGRRIIIIGGDGSYYSLLKDKTFELLK